MLVAIFFARRFKLVNSLIITFLHMYFWINFQHTLFVEISFGWWGHCVSIYLSTLPKKQEELRVVGSHL